MANDKSFDLMLSAVARIDILTRRVNILNEWMAQSNARPVDVVAFLALWASVGEKISLVQQIVDEFQAEEVRG